MNKLFIFTLFLGLLSCSHPKTDKIRCYAWMGNHQNSTDSDMKRQFADLKEKGIDALLYSAGHNPEDYKRIGKIAKKEGLLFYAWVPTMIQEPVNGLKAEWYMVNGRGESAFDKPAYVGYYKFLCPSHEEVCQYLENLYLNIANISEVDGVHLDYIRFPDVILARGLWNKYGLVMDKEYPQFDYCYCDKCVADFQAKTGIDIKSVEDPSKLEEWKQFRYDLITNFVNRLAAKIHSRNKQISAAVFPGPNSVAKKIVRQEWNKWDLDAFFPMNYNDFYLEGTSWIGAMCKESAKSLSGSTEFYSGLFILPVIDGTAKNPDPEGQGLNPVDLEEAIKESMQNGASGICLFTPGRMTEKHWKAFERAIYKKYPLSDSLVLRK